MPTKEPPPAKPPPSTGKASVHWAPGWKPDAPKEAQWVTTFADVVKSRVMGQPLNADGSPPRERAPRDGGGPRRDAQQQYAEDLRRQMGEQQRRRDADRGRGAEASRDTGVPGLQREDTKERQKRQQQQYADDLQRQMHSQQRRRQEQRDIERGVAQIRIQLDKA